MLKHRFISQGVTIVLGALILCSAAFINGAPILFPDTLSYLLDGMALVRLGWPGNERPVFYGLAIWFLHWERSAWPIVLAQGLIVSHLIGLTLRALEASSQLMTTLAVILFLTVGTPLSWYVSHIMPDVFAGALILAMFTLGFCAERLGRAERLYLFMLSTAAICFHLSHLPIALAIAAAACLTSRVAPQSKRRVRAAPLITSIGLALCAFFSFSLVVYKKLDLVPKSPPFLLARMVADGPARNYLELACRQPVYVICNYLQRIPSTENEILWEFLAPMRASPDFWAIKDEQGTIVWHTVLMFPAAVAWNFLTGTAMQLITIDSATQFGPSDWASLRDHYEFAGPDPAHTMQGEGLLAPPRLNVVNALHAVVAISSLLACVILTALCLRARAWRPVALFGIVALGLVTNALATGGLAGVFGRYQGRVIWLLPFCAISLVLVLARARAGGRFADPTIGSLPDNGSLLTLTTRPSGKSAQ